MKTLLVLLLCSQPALAKTHDYQDGKLLNVSKSEDMGVAAPISNGAIAISTGHAIFVVQVADLIYTVRGERTNRNTKDYAKGLIVGDPVKVAVEGNSLILLLPNGKDLGTSILTREWAN